MTMKHIFQQGNKEEPVLLLLHGTGGTESDLLPIAEMVSPGSSILSIRGNVLENGMPRFFRRLSEGIFDEEDLLFRTKELNQFLDDAAKEYGFSRGNLVALGYSNGANIAASLLFHYDDSLKGAILHHPMVPRRGIELPSLTGVPVFIGAGVNDPICPATETEEIGSILSAAGAEVEIVWKHFGHQLSLEEVEDAKAWFQKNFQIK